MYNFLGPSTCVARRAGERREREREREGEGEREREVMLRIHGSWKIFTLSEFQNFNYGEWKEN